MTKLLALLLPDGTTTAPATDFGSVPPGTTTASRSLLLKNTGDEAIPSIRGHIDQTSTADGAYLVTVGSTALTGTAQELLSASLDPGATLSVSERWTVPGGVSATVDTGTLVFDYEQ